MENSLIFISIASLLVLYSYFFYIKDIFALNTKPHVYTWFVATIVIFINTLAMIKGGSGYSSAPFIVGTIMCFVVFILCFKFGTKNINKNDFIFLLLALLCLVLYLFSINLFYVVTLFVLIDLFAYIPTIRKTWYEPETENFNYYFISFFINLLFLFSLKNHNFLILAYPVFLLLTNMVLCAEIFFRKRHLNVK